MQGELLLCTGLTKNRSLTEPVADATSGEASLTLRPNYGEPLRANLEGTSLYTPAHFTDLNSSPPRRSSQGFSTAAHAICSLTEPERGQLPASNTSRSWRLRLRFLRQRTEGTSATTRGPLTWPGTHRSGG